MVVVLDANPYYLGSDIRILEKTYQLLYQVMGRAGRESNKGIIVLQTIEPNNQLIRLIADYNKEKFVNLELENRKKAMVPPFTKFTLIKVESKNEIKLLQFLQEMQKHLPQYQNSCIILGPAPAPLSKLNKFFRYRFLIKSDKSFNVQNMIKLWTQELKIPNHVRLIIDIDPYSFT